MIYVAGSGDNGLYAFYPNGTLKWKFDGPDTSGATAPPPGDPAVASDGTIYYVTTGNSGGAGLWAVNPNGTLKWSKVIEGVKTPAIASDGTIYVSSSDTSKALSAFNPDGTTKWTISGSGFS